jgi:hypothetical protein
MALSTVRKHYTPVWQRIQEAIDYKHVRSLPPRVCRKFAIEPEILNKLTATVLALMILFAIVKATVFLVMG